MRKPKVEKRGDTLIIKIIVNPFANGEHTNYSGYGYHNKGTNKHKRTENRQEEKRVQRGDHD